MACAPPAQGRIRTITLSGDPSPGAGGGTFNRFVGRRSLNDPGQVAFHAILSGTAGGSTDNLGLFLWDGAQLVELARKGDAVDTGGTIVRTGVLRHIAQVTGAPALNNSGVVAFGAHLSENPSRYGVFRVSAGNPIETITRLEYPVPDTNGVIQAFNPQQSIDQAGEVMVWASLKNTSGGSGVDSDVLLRSGGAGLTQVIRAGHAAPTNGNFSYLLDHVSTLSGKMAVSAFLSATTGGAGVDDWGVFRANGGIAEVARMGDAAPGASGGEVNSFQGLRLNEEGRALMSVNYRGAVESTNDEAVLMYTGSNVVEFLRDQDHRPLSSGEHAFNNVDSFAYASLAGIVRADWNASSGSATTRVVAPSGGPAPPGGTFNTFHSSTTVLMNNQCHIAFYASISGGPINFAIYFADADLNLQPVVEHGQALEGSTVTQVSFLGGPSGYFSNLAGVRGINDSGQVVFWAKLADARTGIFLWTPPAPVSSISATNKFTWGANIGWCNWEGDVTNGAIIGTHYCQGLIWDANTGWINLGDGSPANGFSYANTDGADAGVNHDGAGNLRGLAWGANIGWIRFEDTGQPTVDLMTGAFSGYAWSANVGWLNLGDLSFALRTDTIAPGPDRDKDGIPDPFEYASAGVLTALNKGSSDADADGVSDTEEHIAGTDPTDSNDLLRVTGLAVSGTPAETRVTWKSEASRVYGIEWTGDLAPPAWSNAGGGLVRGAAGPETTVNVPRNGETSGFYRVKARLPMAP